MALRVASEALVRVRFLVSQPITPATQQAILDAVDAIHNLPKIAAASPFERAANEYLVDAALVDLRTVFERNHWRSEWLQ